MSVAEVLARVDVLSLSAAGDTAHGEVPRKLSLVELTGGEPLLQPEVIPLAKKLLENGYTVMIETSGERPIAELPR